MSSRLLLGVPPVILNLMTDVTRILSAIEHGDPNAADQLLPLVYGELRKLAAAKMAREAPGQTLQATALVHEAYVRLVDKDAAPQFSSRGHFFAAAAEAMRRILVDQARRKRRLRHGGAGKRIDLAHLDVPDEATADHFIAVDEALALLAAEEAVAAEIVKLRYFAGLTMAQAAETLGMSLRTANRHWAFARAWLCQKLSEQAEMGQ
jgi:RNA polymerase sigma factor (TIGR02999 family)